MARANVASVDEYIAAQPADVRDTLRRVRAAIRKGLPRAVESMSYGMPAYRVDGVAAIYFAAWKNHYSLYPATAAVVAALGDHRGRCEVENGTIRFSFEGAVPVRLVARIAKLRGEEAAVRAKARKARAPRTRA